MKTLVSAVLLLVLLIPQASGAGSPSYEITWKQPPDAKSSDLQIADLAFETNPHLGLAFPGQDLDNYFLLQQCGFGMVRITVSWETREPARGQFTWRGLDNKIRTLHGMDIDVFLTLQSDAAWGTVPATDLAANHPPSDMADWEDFVKALVERYDHDGIDDMPGLRKAVRYYQVVNEWPSPDNRSGGWTGTIDELITFVNHSFDAVKQASNEAQLVLGGIPAAAMDAMVLNAGDADYTARVSYSETAKDTLNAQLAQDPRVQERVDIRERVLAESSYDMADVHLYGPVEYNRYRVARMRRSIGDHPLISSECGGPNLAYDPDFTPEDHFRTVMHLNLDALSRGLEFSLWLFMFERPYASDNGPTWGNSQLQLIDVDHQPKAGFWAYRLLAACLDHMTSVERLQPGAYLVHRDGLPDVTVAWAVPGHDTLQLPAAAEPRQMLKVTDAVFGLYAVDLSPESGTVNLGALPLVVSEELPGGAYAAGQSPTLVPLDIP